jgi:hypothetical protein
MSITYTIDQDRKIIYTTIIGHLTLQDAREYFRKLKEDQSIPQHLNGFLDLRETKTIPTTQQLVEITKEIHHLQSRVTWGFCAITASEPALYGMGRVLGVIAQAMFSDIQVFYTNDEAKIWLDSKINTIM